MKDRKKCHEKDCHLPNWNIKKGIGCTLTHAGSFFA